jgi:hypothetical protein
MEDVSAVRLRLAEIVRQAEIDEEFSERLAADPTVVLAENDIPENAVEEFSQVIARARSGDVAEDPTGCINTQGCADFTCFTSQCGPTCKVTIVIAPPDA